MLVTKYIRRLLVFSSMSLVLGALGSWSNESEAANCPYDGDYTACLVAGQTVDYCKRYVLNCENDEPMEPESGSCEWLLDDVLGNDCPFGPGFVRIGFPLDITSNSGDCPYDSYTECLLSEEHYQDAVWCKAHQLTCVPQPPSVTVVVPMEAGCGPLHVNGTILFKGTTEIIGGNYCVHVTSFDYTGGQSNIVDDAINDQLAVPNPECGGDKNCVCMPVSCL